MTHRMKQTLLAICAIILISVGAGVSFYEPPPAPAQQSSVVEMTTNQHGHRIPLIDAVALDGSAVRPLSEALRNDRRGVLSRYVRAYFFYANNLVVTRSPLTPESRIEFVIDTLGEQVWAIDWSPDYPVGVDYDGDAIVSADRLHELAYGIFLEWTGENDWRAALAKFTGRVTDEPTDFLRALFHIHRQLLVSMYVPEIASSAEIAFLPTPDEASRLVARHGSEKAWQRIARGFEQSTDSILTYVDSLRLTRPQSFNQDAYVAISYFLGPQVMAYRRLEAAIGDQLESAHSSETLERRRAERAERERKEEERRRREEQRQRLLESAPAPAPSTPSLPN